MPDFAAVQYDQSFLTNGSSNYLHLLILFSEWASQIQVDSIIALNNVKVKVIQGHLRLALDKWSTMTPSTRPMRGDFLMDPNFSETEYQESKRHISTEATQA